MQTLTQDIEKSARMIFRLFFGSDVQVKNTAAYNYSSWGVDLLMDCNGKRKLSLFMEENTLKSIMKHLTGEDNIQNSALAYKVMGEIARFIAGNAIGERHDNFTLYNPVQSQGLKNPELYTKTFSSNLGKFYIAIE